jgi:putative transposase
MHKNTDDRLTGWIKPFSLEPGGVYGYRKIHEVLSQYGERCGPNKVYRFMRLAGLKAQVGYGKSQHRGGAANIVVPNRLKRRVTTMAPDDAWITDITHIRTHEGWLDLAVVVGLRKIHAAVIIAPGIKRPIPETDSAA